MKSDDVVEQTYDRLAPSYDRRWQYYVRETVSATARRIAAAPSARVLDVGCGTGELLRALAARHPPACLLGVDLSAGMLDEARRKLGHGVRLVQGSALSLPFGGESFEVVVSSSALHFFGDVKAALAQMHRVLKPGGQLVITDWCQDYLSCKLLDQILRRTDPSHRPAYSSAELLGLLGDAGFEVERLERYKIDWLWGLMTVTARRPAAAP